MAALPAIDIDLTPLAHLKQALDNYLGTVWSNTWPPDRNIPSLPYADIMKNPGIYFDLETFQWPTAFKAPRDLNGAETHMLFSFLDALYKAGTPFHFHSRSEIEGRIADKELELQNKRE